MPVVVAGLIGVCVIDGALQRRGRCGAGRVPWPALLFSFVCFDYYNNMSYVNCWVSFRIVFWGGGASLLSDEACLGAIVLFCSSRTELLYLQP